MPNFEAGSFVVHAKLPDLGSGEILSNDKGTVRIRFASGERAFAIEKAEAHLAVTQEAPAPPENKRAKKKKAATKAAAPKSVAP
ncbi:MAG TPA: hypothetical protein VFX59_08585 [Polyangiales bacterium]|nr:hypothetical protein [Polyangiales bacterium]